MKGQSERSETLQRCKQPITAKNARQLPEANVILLHIYSCTL